MSKNLYICKDAHSGPKPTIPIFYDDDLNNMCNMHNGGAYFILDLLGIKNCERVPRDEFLEKCRYVLSNVDNDKYDLRHIASFLLVAAIHTDAEWFTIA